MSRDIERLLERAAGAPARVGDVHELWRRGRRRRRRDMGIAACATALVVLGVALYGPSITSGDRGGPPAGERSGAPATCNQPELGCVRVAPGEPVKLGTLLAISGEVEPLGLDSQRGAVLAADRRGNEVAGHPIEWRHEDDLCSAEGGEAGGRRLADDDQIVAVIGTSCSSSAEIAAKILSDRGVVLMSPSNTAPHMTDPAGHQPFYLRTAPNDKIQGAAMAEFVTAELGVGLAATIHDGSSYTEMMVKEFAETFEAAGGDITARESVAPDDRDFRRLLTAIAATGPELIYYPLFVDQGALITAQAREIDALNEVDLAGADGMLTPDWIRAAGPNNAEGVYLSGLDLDFGGDRYEEAVLGPYRGRWGEPTSVFHAHAFDAANLVLDAIEEIAIRDANDGSTYIPRSALRDSLFATFGYQGVTGELDCRDNGDCNLGASVEVSRVVDGDFRRVWVRPAGS